MICPHGARVHDGATATSSHGRDDSLRREEIPANKAEVLVKLTGGNVKKRFRLENAGIVEQYVYTAEPLRGDVNHSPGG